MRKNSIYMILFVPFLFFSCGTHKKKDEQTNTIQSVTMIELKKECEDLLSSVTDSISYLELKENDVFFSEINKIKITDKYIYILDKFGAKALLQFDREGNFIRTIGSLGNGPGEYNLLWDFDVDAEYVYMCDARKKTLLVYNVDGSFQKEKKLPLGVEGIKSLRNGKFLLSILCDLGVEQKLVLADSSFEVEKVLLKYEKTDTRDLAVNNLFQVVDNRILYNKAIDDIVYLFSDTGELLEKYHVNFGEKKVPVELRKSYEEFSVIERERDKYVYFTDTPLIIGKRLIGNVMDGTYRATFICDMKNGDYQIYKYIPMELDCQNVYLPMCFSEGYLVTWMDMSVYENMKKAPVLEETMIKNLEGGGHVLCFYRVL